MHPCHLIHPQAMKVFRERQMKLAFSEFPVILLRKATTLLSMTLKPIMSNEASEQYESLPEKASVSDLHSSMDEKLRHGYPPPSDHTDHAFLRVRIKHFLVSRIPLSACESLTNKNKRLLIKLFSCVLFFYVTRERIKCIILLRCHLLSCLAICSRYFASTAVFCIAVFLTPVLFVKYVLAYYVCHNMCWHIYFTQVNHNHIYPLCW